MKETPRILGIIGYPLDQTLSPAIHNGACRRMGLPFCYLPFAVAPRYLPNLLRCMRLTDVEGLNVTTPHKVAVVPLLDGLDLLARRIGAVNTIVLRRGRYIGYNTDAPAFATALHAVTRRDWAGASATVLGAGGAARAVIYALGETGVDQVTIINRRLTTAAKLVAHFHRALPRVKMVARRWSTESLRKAMPTTDLLVQATTLPYESALRTALNYIPPSATVFDLNYGAKTTRIGRLIKRQGFRYVDGLPMLIEQAALSFAIFTGRKMDRKGASRDAHNSLIYNAIYKSP
ncbi:MAG: shikimate dehydrogenase [Deltaproteobacteria bacterium]|nr:shikimate dehydrogenase [Deltaproteobacteria bacterium]